MVYLLLFSLQSLAANYTLSTSEITYNVEHIAHSAQGLSKEAKGKITCTKEKCKLLVAAPIKSFSSGDSNRDHHMLETTKGALNPMVVLKGEIPKTFFQGRLHKLNLKLLFAGKENPLVIEEINPKKSTKGYEIDFNFPLSLTEYELERPALLMVPVSDEIKITVKSTWEEEK
ncbi:MAG: hypothetical protein M9962_15590 [Oligoflexia bacterium]|nr:hypothetical protein [Oligoflexia bacterium]